MGEVVAFPRKTPRREHPATALETIDKDVERMMARGYSEDEAFEIAVMRSRALDSHGRD